MNTSSRYPEWAGPWWASAETISSWIWPKTKLSDIFSACLEWKDESIGALNSLCISLWVNYRFTPETIDDDIAHFSAFLEKAHFLEDISWRVNDIIIDKLPEWQTDNMRDFLERINTGRDNPKEAYFIATWDLKNSKISEIHRDLAHAVLSMCISLWWVHGIYVFFIFCRTIGLI